MNLLSNKWIQKANFIISYETKNVIVCPYHVTYPFQTESTLYSCVDVKELLARNKRKIWSLSDRNGTRTHNHLVRKWTLNHLTKLPKLFVYELSGCGFESRCSHLKNIIHKHFL